MAQNKYCEIRNVASTTICFFFFLFLFLFGLKVLLLVYCYYYYFFLLQKRYYDYHYGSMYQYRWMDVSIIIIIIHSHTITSYYIWWWSDQFSFCMVAKINIEHWKVQKWWYNFGGWLRKLHNISKLQVGILVKITKLASPILLAMWAWAREHFSFF